MWILFKVAVNEAVWVRSTVQNTMCFYLNRLQHDRNTDHMIYGCLQLHQFGKNKTTN